MLVGTAVHFAERIGRPQRQSVHDAIHVVVVELHRTYARLQTSADTRVEPRSPGGRKTSSVSCGSKNFMTRLMSGLLTWMPNLSSCTAFINDRRRPTKPWECSCVRFVNTQEHCDGLMHLLVTIFRTDPLDEKLIRPMHNILCHPLATAACGEMGIGLPGG